MKYEKKYMISENKIFFIDNGLLKKCDNLIYSEG